MKSWKTPTPEQINKAIALLGQVEQQRYFFERLENPLWVSPLQKVGIFETPLPPQKHDDGSVSFPSWPASQYLARMAAHSEVQLEISPILLKVGVPENYSIHQDFLKIAQLLPAEFQCKWARLESKWLRDQTRVWAGLLSDELAELGISLLRRGNKKRGMKLLYDLLDPLPDDRSPVERKIEGLWTMPPTPRSRVENWAYERILNKVVPIIAEQQDFDLLTLFERLLNRTITLSQDSQEGRDPFSDLSFTWRPAIEDHPQNQHLHDIEDTLVTALRDCSTLIVEKDPSRLRPVSAQLEGFTPRRAIFTRIGLHLLRTFPASAAELISERIVNEELFRSPDVQHEYMLLLRQEFKNLSPQNQRRILWWIWRRYSPSRVREILSKQSAQPPTEEHVQAFMASHRVDWLSMIKSDLPPRWKSTYEEFSAVYKPSPHPEFIVYSEGVMQGDQSPVDRKELADLAIPDLVAYLKTWKPDTNRFMGPSIRGLGLTLQSIIVERPERFLNETFAFGLQEPTYVRSVIDGFRDVAVAGKPFEWEPILDLCMWAVSQPRDLPDRDSLGDDQDPSWGWTRSSIVHLLDEGFRREAVLIPFSLRDRVWQILQPLTEDRDPTPDDEEKYGDSRKRPYDYALNCTRGSAMLAVMRYLSWMRLQLERQPDAEEILKKGLDLVPEVREVLEKRLDPKTEPSRAIRSAYGLYFPWLVQWDKIWASDHLTNIFPRERELLDLRLAAWNTYLQWCRPFDEPFELLDGEYEWAVTRLEEGQEEEGSDSPIETLGEHLVAYYWRGKIGLEPASLLSRFFQKANDKIRGRLMSFIGQTLKNSPPRKVPATIIERLKGFWVARLQVAKAGLGASGFQDEMAAFGWWVISKQFEDEWVLCNLYEALDKAGRVDMPPDVQAFLAETSPHSPELAIKCLGLMIKGGRNPWEGPWIASHEEHNRPIIKNARDCGDPVAQALAMDLVNRLGAMGFLSYRDLLNS